MTTFEIPRNLALLLVLMIILANSAGAEVDFLPGAVCAGIGTTRTATMSFAIGNASPNDWQEVLGIAPRSAAQSPPQHERRGGGWGGPGAWGGGGWGEPPPAGGNGWGGRAPAAGGSWGGWPGGNGGGWGWGWP